MKKTIYLLGNPLVEEDSLPVEFLPKLKSQFPNINFQIIDPTENFPEEDNLILIDTIINIKKVSILTKKDLSKIQTSPNYSLHDFDLAMQLKLMQKLGKLKKLTIIGIPPSYDKIHTLEEIEKIIRKI